MADSVPIATPYVFPSSQAFHGNDGLWSTFIVRIGSPAQDFNVLPSTNGGDPVVPLTQGCVKNLGNESEASCGALRGALPFNNRDSYGFSTNSSTTWQNIGLFGFDLGRQWGIDTTAQFGYETVGLAAQNSGGPTFEGQVVAGIATKEYLLGMFPLDVKPTNFSTFDDPQPSYLANSKNKSIIPGLGFGYTAGAHYRYSGMTASLVFGGYDASKYDGNTSKTFQFGPDDSHSFTLGVQNIIAENTLLGTVSPITDGIIASIDSTLPYLWLPREVCDRFETALGLRYDNDSSLYLVNDTVHAQLKQLNPTVSFTLGEGTTSGTGKENSVVIKLPYAAFDLQVSWPLMKNQTKYFPLKRTTNSTQYTLGRTFLQEAYLGVDYEQHIFNVSQARFDSPMPAQQIVPVLPPSNATKIPASSASHLSGAAKAGIAVGVAGAVILALLLCFLWYKRKCRAMDGHKEEQNSNEGSIADAKEAGSTGVSEVHENWRPNEADSEGCQIYELPNSRNLFELQPVRRFHEMMLDRTVHETPAERN